MTVVCVLTAVEPLELLPAHLDFHAAAGVERFVIGRELASDQVEAAIGGRHAVDLDDARPPDVGDWVMRGTCTELWWPRGGTLRELLALVPEDAVSVQALERAFAPAADDGRPFYERTIHRVVPEALALDGPPARGAPRRRALVRVLGDDPGSHPPAQPQPTGWFPVEVLSFPRPGEAELDRNAADTSYRLVEDVRVRDALRLLAAGRPLDFPRPGAVDDPSFALEVAMLAELDVAAVRLRLEELEGAVAAAADAPSLRARLVRRVRRAGRQGR